MCCEAQWSRGWWLKTEIIAFWVLFLTYPGPFLSLRCFDKKSHDTVLNRDSDAESTESEQEEDEDKDKEEEPKEE